LILERGVDEMFVKQIKKHIQKINSWILRYIKHLNLLCFNLKTHNHIQKTRKIDSTLLAFSTRLQFEDRH
jgi:hypothetical protein